ncbi:hypothetical protein quinque_008828 [Culex quinquefasciatus]
MYRRLSVAIDEGDVFGQTKIVVAAEMVKTGKQSGLQLDVLLDDATWVLTVGRRIGNGKDRHTMTYGASPPETADASPRLPFRSPGIRPTQVEEVLAGLVHHETIFRHGNLLVETIVEKEVAAMVVGLLVKTHPPSSSLA